MSQATIEELENRVRVLEDTVASLVADPRRAPTKDWRSTVGMFKDDAVMAEIQEEARKIREADGKQLGTIPTMILVDTDHINVLQSVGVRANLLNAQMAASVGQYLAVAAVTIEEQMRGWLALIHRTHDVEKQIPAYERLVSLFEFFARWQVIPFDLAVAREFKRLRGIGVRTATMDLKIAATALVHEATLLSANRRDFEQVPGLAVEDWLHD